MVRRRNNIVVIRLTAPRKVTLPGEKRSMKCERRKKDLPPNVTIRSRYKKQLAEEDSDGEGFQGVREK